MVKHEESAVDELVCSVEENMHMTNKALALPFPPILVTNVAVNAIISKGFKGKKYSTLPNSISVTVYLLSNSPTVWLLKEMKHKLMRNI